MSKADHRRDGGRRVEGRTREGLQWRRTPLAWMAGLPGYGGMRGDPTLARPPAAVQALCERLLATGGKMACVPTFLPLMLCRILLMAGRPFPSDNVEFRKGLPNECHANSARAWARDKAGRRIAHGFALPGDDETWRHHSWVVTDGGKIIETTVPWVAYFGIEMDYEACRAFHAAVCGKAGGVGSRGGK